MAALNYILTYIVPFAILIIVHYYHRKKSPIESKLLLVWDGLIGSLAALAYLIALFAIKPFLVKDCISDIDCLISHIYFTTFFGAVSAILFLIYLMMIFFGKYKSK